MCRTFITWNTSTTPKPSHIMRFRSSGTSPAVGRSSIRLTGIDTSGYVNRSRSDHWARNSTKMHVAVNQKATKNSNHQASGPLHAGHGVPPTSRPSKNVRMTSGSRGPVQEGRCWHIWSKLLSLPWK